MEQVRLEKITYANVEDVLDLTVKDDQKNYVASNSDSLVEAYLTLSAGRNVFPFCIRAGDTAVGFLMIGYDYKDDFPAEDEEIPVFMKGNYILWRLMIDREHQGKGYGKEAVRLALEFIRSFPCGEADYCWLSYEPENEAARDLYRSFGFIEEDRLPRGWEEIPALLKLK